MTFARECRTNYLVIQWVNLQLSMINNIARSHFHFAPFFSFGCAFLLECVPRGIVPTSDKTAKRIQSGNGNPALRIRGVLILAR